MVEEETHLARSRKKSFLSLRARFEPKSGAPSVVQPRKAADKDDIFSQIFEANQGRLGDQSAESKEVQDILRFRQIGPSVAFKNGQLVAPFGIKPGSKVLDLYNARPQTSTHTEDVKAAIGFINDHPVRFPGIWNRNTSDPETAELRPVLAALDRARHHHQGAELGTPPAHEVPECTESTSLGQSHTESRSIVRPIDHASIVADDGSGLSFQLKPEHEELLELASKVKASTGVETDDSAADKDSTYTGSSSPVQSKSEALSIIQAIDRVTTLTDNESRYSFELEPEHEEPLTSPQEAKLFKPVLSIPAEIDHSKHPAFLANHAEDDESIEPQADSPTLGAGSSQDAWWIAGTDAQHENLEGHIPASKPPPLNVQKGKDKSDSRHKASDFNTLTSYRNPRSVEVSEPTITTNIQALESTLSDKEVSKILQKTKPAAGPVAFTPDREITPVSKGKGTTPSKSNKLNTCTQSSSQQNTLQSVSDREPGNDSCTPYTSKMVSSKTTPTRKRFLNSIKTSITTPLASRFSFGSPTNTTTVTPSTPGVLSPATQYFQRFPIDVRSPKDDLDTYARRSQSPQRLRRALDQVDDATKDNICKREVERIRTYTGTRAIYYDAANPSLDYVQHPNHFRLWKSKNLCCFFHHDNCERCGSPCCAYMGAAQIAQARTSLPDEKVAATKVISDIRTWYPVSDEMSTFVMCATCKKFRCPECCGVCSDPRCHLPKCRGCTPDIWGPCENHKWSRVLKA